MLDKFLTTKEVSEALQITHVHLMHIINTGKLKAYRLGDVRAVRIKQSDLEIFMNQAVINRELMKKGEEFHLRLLETMVDGKMSGEAALEFLKGGDPEGYQAHEYFQAHKFDKPSAPDIGNLRFDSPTYAASRANVSAGGDFESEVDRIMKREDCRECEAVRLLMQSPEGQKLFEKHWSEVEEAARRRNNAQRF
jgi:excisionase family DNA binding protein